MVIMILQTSIVDKI
ncbi:hypothetical protein DERP_009539, partial [Dermatophagoides pteronyssinus]